MGLIEHAHAPTLTSAPAPCADPHPGAIRSQTGPRIAHSVGRRADRFDLPEPTRTQHPDGNLLAQEASGVTGDRDTGTVFVVWATAGRRSPRSRSPVSS